MTKRTAAVSTCHLITIATLLSAPAALAQAQDSALQKRHSAASQRIEAVQPEQSTHPDAELRRALERGDAQLDAAAASQPDARDLVQPPSPGWSQRALEEPDWPALFAAAGPAVAGLQLALAAPPGPYQLAIPFQLAFGLTDRSGSPRTLHALSACGSLERAEGVWFRVWSDTGEEVRTPLVFKDADDAHAHAPLQVDGNGSLRSLVDLSQLAATSPELYQLLAGAAQIGLEAELPALGLISNRIFVAVVPGAGVR